MSILDLTCGGMDDSGRRCLRRVSVVIARVPVCGAHGRGVVDAIRRDSVPHAALDDAPTRAVLPHDNVYYLLDGPAVKIGTTGQIRTRVRELRKVFPQACLAAIEPGGLGLEQRRHRQFRQFRTDVGREWFHAVPTLLQHVQSVRDKHGLPRNIPTSWSISPADVMPSRMEDVG